MRGDPKKLIALSRLAKIRSDAELKRFSAFRTHIETLQTSRARTRADIGQIYAGEEGFSVETARLANIESGRLAHQLGQLDHEIGRLRPGFEKARERAAHEFGRVEALRELARLAGKRGR